jgi:hypothetical protein
MKAARVLTLAERTLVAEWIACAGDIAEAYVSNRRTDDPALRNRVVIVTRPEDGPTHLFHAPARRGIWIVLSFGVELRSTSPCEGWIEKSCQYALVEIAAGRSASRIRADTRHVALLPVPVSGRIQY